MILGGYLNLTLSEKEKWGATTRQDSLSAFFAVMFDSKELVDLQPLKLTPTWRNNRCGEQAISKRLDKFFISKNLLSGCMIVKTWVEVGGLFDRLPILLRLQGPKRKPTALFKFNPSWIQEEDYRKLVVDS